ncbi:hypothetical protein V5O48_007101 [Marasmius crinis-equi]|uniref:JmjC domain-containing protein n=1 Tax=Marasmius crinis-equi TaxID=585013 RepID=A0ABR3FI59_9AGAR
MSEPSPYSFLFRVWELLSTSAKASHYFLTPSEMSITDWELRKEAWWGRVSPLLEGKVVWPTIRVGSTQEWERLILPESGCLKDGIKRMNIAFSTHKSRKKPKEQKRSYAWQSEPELGSSQPPKKRKTTRKMKGGEQVIGGDQSIGMVQRFPSGDHLDKPIEFTVPSVDPVQSTVFNLVPAQADDSPGKAHAPITWTGTNGIQVLTEFPYHPMVVPGGSRPTNALWKAAEVLSALAEIGLTESTTAELTVVDEAQHSEAEITDMASACLAMNRLLLVRGTRTQGEWVGGLSPSFSDSFGVQEHRKCEVFDYVRREVNALRGGADTSPKDELYERVIPPIPGQPRTYLPKGNDEREVELMDYGVFLDQVNDGRILFILDFPITRRKGITYSALDHTDECLNNTKWLGDAEMWRDLTWGLSHAGQVVTWLHHDGDGKMTVIQALTGAKIWTVFVPSSSLSSKEVQDVHKWLAERKDKLPVPSLGKLVNILLLRDDTLFMPPGMMHLVYTPVPSIFRGSSFWNFHALHLTAFSLRGDSLAADILTNIDHCYRMVFQTILRLVLALPVMTDYVPRRAVVYNLYDLLQNPQDYIFVAPKDDDYPRESQVEVAWQKSSMGKKASPVSRSSVLDSMIASVKQSRTRVLKSVKHFRRAVQILEVLIECDGKIVPPVDEVKRSSSKAWIAELEGCSPWSDPGPVIQVDRSVLLTVLKDDAHDLSDLSDLSDVE